MEFMSHNAELAIANDLFERIFNNIRIQRVSKENKKSLVKVNCLWGQRSRIVKNLENSEKRGNMKLPMIVIERTGYSRNSDRLANLHNEVKYEMSSSNRKYELMTPVPVDVSYDVTVIAKYPQDIDKIASNFMVFFNNDIFVSCEHPKYEGIQLNNQVVMNDSVNEDHPSELQGENDDIQTAQFSFTFKTWLFAGIGRAKKVHPKVISTDISTFISTYIDVLQPDEIDAYQLQYPTKNLTVEIKSNEIDDFQKAFPNKSASAEMTSLVSVPITSYVDDISTDIYDGMPIVTAIDFGFYTVPKQFDIPSYIESVDNEILQKHYHVDLSGNISDDYYDIVDHRCTLEPYVDKIFWRIDGVTDELVYERR